MDVKIGFLNSKFQAEILMRAPGAIKFEGNKVCKLNEALNDLKQTVKC